MIKSLILAVAMVMAAPATDTLTKDERDKAIAELEGSKKMFLDATKGLSAEQWNFKAAPDRWSIAECADHIALSEAFIFARVGDVMKTPPTPEKRNATAGKDEKLVVMLQDRSFKAKAPEPLDPTKTPMAP